MTSNFFIISRWTKPRFRVGSCVTIWYSTIWYSFHAKIFQFMTSFSRLSVFTANLMQLAPGCLCCLSYIREWNYILLSPGFVCLQEDGVPRIWPFWELFGCIKTSFVSRSNKCPNTIIFSCYFHKRDRSPQRPCHRTSHQSDDY